MTKESEDAKLNALDEKHESKKQNTSEEPLSVVGQWIDVKRESLSYDGRLYPETYRFQVKPVATKTIKYFSMLDENNPMSVNDALTYVIKHHVRVLQDNRNLDVLSCIHEHDRFYFVMLVHTYSGAPTALSFPTSCKSSSCKQKQDAVITPYALRYQPLSDKANDWLNVKTGVFNIDTKIGKFHYKPLSLQESIDLTEFTMKKRRDDEEIEQLFTRVAPLLMHSREPHQTIDDVYQRYLRVTSDSQKIALFLRIIEILDIKQLLEIEVNCQKCKKPFRAPISSVAGLRNIFVVHDIDDLFNA